MQPDCRIARHLLNKYSCKFDRQWPWSIGHLFVCPLCADDRQTPTSPRQRRRQWQQSPRQHRLQWQQLPRQRPAQTVTLTLGRSSVVFPWQSSSEWLPWHYGSFIGRARRSNRTWSLTIDHFSHLMLFVPSLHGMLFFDLHWWPKFCTHFNFARQSRELHECTWTTFHPHPHHFWPHLQSPYLSPSPPHLHTIVWQWLVLFLTAKYRG